MNLGSNELSGPIPVALGGLSKLEMLYLSDNQLNGPIPAELADLDGLRVLWLRYNELTGEIPPELGNMAALDELLLAGNQLSGCIPTNLRDLRHDDLHLVGLPFCTLGSLMPDTGGHVPPTKALLVLMIIGAAVFAAGLRSVFRGEGSTSPS